MGEDSKQILGGKKNQAKQCHWGAAETLGFQELFWLEAVEVWFSSKPVGRFYSQAFMFQCKKEKGESKFLEIPP